MKKENKVVFCVQFLIISLLFFSCKEKKTEQLSTDTVYINIDSIVQSDIDLNMRENCKMEKLAFVNSLKEKKLTDSVDWKQELDILKDCDINKPSWKGKFKVDIVPTTIAHPGCTQYFYRSIDTKIPIKSITVNKDSLDRILNILIQKKIESFLFSSNQQIEYIPRFGYSVRSDQKTSLFSTFNVNVDVKYICK
ncbi:MAG TPA: hypothetical protein PK431_06685 [Chitinophagales bacterium]|nr:hypothetical protein [Chitinophagales bacterium]